MSGELRGTFSGVKTLNLYGKAHPEAPRDVIPDNNKVRHYLSKIFIFTTYTYLCPPLQEDFNSSIIFSLHSKTHGKNKGQERFLLVKKKNA